jgi:two-component system chemotaxis response regulator CheB
VTICPPQSWLELMPDGSYLLRAVTEDTRFYPHDALLTSLAHAYASRGLAVVLTGMGHDGAAGTAALLTAGATVIAQSEASSEFSSMPMAATEAGAETMPLDEIAAWLVRLTERD